MQRNLELKASIPDLHAAAHTALSLGAHFKGTISQRDTYFRVSRGRLKLREIRGSAAELIFYDRAEESAQRVSSFEIYRSEHPDKLASVLSAALGVTGVIEKERMLYMLGTTRIHLDSVAGMGTFIEFEIPYEVGGAAPLETMRRLISAFELREELYHKGSYIDMRTPSGVSG